MGATLSHFCEAKPDENGNDFMRFENGDVTHVSSNSNVLNPDKLGLQ
jgi:hypothetical protein